MHKRTKLKLKDKKNHKIIHINLIKIFICLYILHKNLLIFNFHFIYEKYSIFKLFIDIFHEMFLESFDTNYSFYLPIFFCKTLHDRKVYLNKFFFKSCGNHRIFHCQALQSFSLIHFTQTTFKKRSSFFITIYFNDGFFGVFLNKHIKNEFFFWCAFSIFLNFTWLGVNSELIFDF